MKTSSAILIVSVMIAATTGLLYERIDRLESRLQRAEQALATLEPLRNVMAGLQPRSPNSPDAYQAVQATGAPNVPPDREDHPHAWCPAKENGSEEWLQLTYAEPITTIAIEVHANNHPGAVIGAKRIRPDGVEDALPVSRTDLEVQQRKTRIPLRHPLELQTLKLVLDTSLALGWNEIDAVALIDSEGDRHWAIQAEASSAWTSYPPPSARDK